MRVLLLALLGLVLSSCGTPTAEEKITLQRVHDDIVTVCRFDTDIESLASLAATITMLVNPAAGAGAQVLVGIGNSIVTDVCKAVVGSSAFKSHAEAIHGKETVIVNGVPVHGTLI